MAWFKCIGSIEGTPVKIKKYAYIPGQGINFTLRDATNDGLLKPIGNRSSWLGEIYIKFYESVFTNQAYLIYCNDYGPTIRCINASGQKFRISYKTNNSNYKEDIEYSTGEHEILINRFSDNKILLDETELTNEYEKASSGTSTNLFMFSVSNLSVQNAWIGYFEELILRDSTDNSDVVHLVPAEIDGKACLYDTINKDCYYYWNMTVMDTIPTT